MRRILFLRQRRTLCSNGGFTMIEVLVALTLFVVIATLTLGIYTFSLRAYERSVSLSRMQSEVALIFEILTKRIRYSSVDYEYYGGTIPTQPVDTLALVDSDGEQYVFRAQNNTLNVDPGNTGTFVSLSSQYIAIASMQFYIEPDTNPFSPSAPPVRQPQVIIVVTVHPQGKTSPELVIEQSVPQRSGL